MQPKFKLPWVRNSWNDTQPWSWVLSCAYSLFCLRSFCNPLSVKWKLFLLWQESDIWAPHEQGPCKWLGKPSDNLWGDEVTEEQCPCRFLGLSRPGVGPSRHVYLHGHTGEQPGAACQTQHQRGNGTRASFTQFLPCLHCLLYLALQKSGSQNSSSLESGADLCYLRDLNISTASSLFVK